MSSRSKASSSASASSRDDNMADLVALAKSKKLQEGSLEDRRRVREQYRALRKQFEVERADLENPQSTALTDSILKLNEQWLSVTHTREADEDYAMANDLMLMGVAQAKQLAKDKSVDPSELQNRIQRRFRLGRAAKEGLEDDEEQEPRRSVQVDFAAIGRASFGLVRDAPVCGFMSGCIRAEKRVVQKQARQKLTQSAEVQLGKAVDLEEISTSDRISITIQHMYDSMPKEVSLYEGFFNPRSFSQTVENIFELSFLLKDGKASLDIGDDGVPMIRKTKEATKEDINSGLKKMHHIFRLDMRDFADICQAYNLGDPMVRRLTDEEVEDRSRRKK